MEIDEHKATLWGNLWQILYQVQRLLADYEILINNLAQYKQVPHIENAYIDSIIVHAAKIFSDSKLETFRLQQFKSVSSHEIKQKFQEVEDQYKDIIGKIITNRNKLVAHLDAKFYELHFSESEIKRMEEDFVNRLRISQSEAKRVSAKFKRTDDKSQERYSIRDFREDFREIKAMIDGLMSIWYESNPLA